MTDRNQRRVSADLYDTMAAKVAELTKERDDARFSLKIGELNLATLRNMVKEIRDFAQHEMDYEDGAEDQDPADFEYYGDRQYIIEEVLRRLTVVAEQAPAVTSDPAVTSAQEATQERGFFMVSVPATSSDDESPDDDSTVEVTSSPGEFDGIVLSLQEPRVFNSVELTPDRAATIGLSMVVAAQHFRAGPAAGTATDQENEDNR